MFTSIDKAAADCGTSRDQLWKLVFRGAIPLPSLIGGLDGIVRWPTATIDEWAAAGCPSCEPPTYEAAMRLKCVDRAEYLSAELEKL